MRNVIAFCWQYLWLNVSVQSVVRVYCAGDSWEISDSLPDFEQVT